MSIAPDLALAALHDLMGTALTAAAHAAARDQFIARGNADHAADYDRMTESYRWQLTLSAAELVFQLEQLEGKPADQVPEWVLRGREKQAKTRERLQYQAIGRAAAAAAAAAASEASAAAELAEQDLIRAERWSSR